MVRRIALVVALGALITMVVVPTVSGAGPTRVFGDIVMNSGVVPGTALTQGDFQWNINEVQQSDPFDVMSATGTEWDDAVLTAHVHVKLNVTTFQGHYWGYSDVTVADPAITCQGSFKGKVDFLGVTKGPWRSTCTDGTQFKAHLSTVNIADPVVDWEFSGRIIP